MKKGRKWLFLATLVQKLKSGTVAILGKKGRKIGKSGHPPESLVPGFNNFQVYVHFSAGPEPNFQSGAKIVKIGPKRPKKGSKMA